jgi:UDP-2,3-diacylglucosamine hydrolase
MGSKIRERESHRRFVVLPARGYNSRVLKSPCYVISDAHLGVASLEIERSLVAFLRGLAGNAGSLLINGDLFDFWFEWKTVIPRNSFRALAALADLRESGVPILWVAGNHDCWGDDVLTKDVGVEYHLGHWEGSIAGWRAKVDHGDGLREKEDRGYRMIKPIMRNRAAIRAFRALHPNWSTRLATGSSSASRTYRSRDEGRGLRAIAMRELESQPSIDLLIYGHSHVAALERAAGGGVFANAGSWLDAPTFLKVSEDVIELRSATPGSTDGECLHSVDRRTEKALADS